MHRSLFFLNIVSWMKSCHLACWSESNFISMLSTLTMLFLLFPYFLLLVLGRYIIVVCKVMSPHWGPQIRHLSHFSSRKSVFCVFTENNLVPHRHLADSCNSLCVSIEYRSRGHNGFSDRPILRCGDMELENENLHSVKNAFFRMPTSNQGDKRSHTQQVVKLKTRKGYVFLSPDVMICYVIPGLPCLVYIYLMTVAMLTLGIETRERGPWTRPSSCDFGHGAQPNKHNIAPALSMEEIIFLNPLQLRIATAPARQHEAISCMHTDKCIERERTLYETGTWSYNIEYVVSHYTNKSIDNIKLEWMERKSLVNITIKVVENVDNIRK